MTCPITRTGSCGTYQYPPMFLLVIVPFTVLSPESATWAWIAVSVLCLVVAVAVMPVPFEARLITLALAGTSWPMLFAIKVGAVGPLLLLVFAAAWRWMDRPVRLALAVAVGALVKLQPALLVLWMVLTRRWRAATLTVGGGRDRRGDGSPDRQPELDRLLHDGADAVGQRPRRPGATSPQRPSPTTSARRRPWRAGSALPTRSACCCWWSWPRDAPRGCLAARDGGGEPDRRACDVGPLHRRAVSPDRLAAGNDTCGGCSRSALPSTRCSCFLSRRSCTWWRWTS